MIGSIIRHSLIFIPFFTFLYFVLKRGEGGSLLALLFIFLPAYGEIIQLGFPEKWGYDFEISDIVINYFSSIVGILGGKFLCRIKFVIDAEKKQFSQR